MKQLNFHSYEDLAADIIEKYETISEVTDSFNITVIGKYLDIKNTMQELIVSGYEISNIELHDDCLAGYSDEFLLALSNVEGRDEIWCQPAKIEGNYVSSESLVVYVMGDCNSAVLKKCEAPVMFEVNFVCTDECDYCTCNDNTSSESVHISTDTNGNPVGFHKSWSTNKDGVMVYSSFSHQTNDINALKVIAADFGIDL